MGGMELVKVLSYVPAIVGLLSVGYFVYINNSTSIKNKLFALFVLATALWQVFLFLGDTATTNGTALWSLRLGLFFGQLVFQMFFYFTLEFPSHTKLSRKALVWLSLPNFLLAFALLTPLGVQTVAIKGFGVQPEAIGAVYTFSDLFGLAYLLASIIILIRKYHRADSAERSQIRYVLIGLSVAILANIFSGLIATLLHIDSNYIWLGSFSLFVFTAFVAYAIIRHKFFDVRPVVARAFTYLLLVGSLSAIFGVVVLGGVSLLFRSNSNTLVVRLVYLTAALLMAFTFQPLRRFFDRLSTRLFYRDAYDPQAFLSQLNSVLVGNLDINLLISRATQVIEQHIRPGFVNFYLVKTPHIASRFNGDHAHSTLLHNLHEMRESVDAQKSKTLFTDSLPDEKGGPHLRSVLQKNNVGAVLCLLNSFDHRTEEVGYVFIGYKKSGNPYTSGDFSVLEIVANELVIAFQNALRFQEIESFNLTLQGKIDDATRKLRHTNERLKLIDQTKDDFISMASHQLRTPLTSVKGYVSMVLDNDAGKINDQQRKLLTQSFFSAERMVYLISDLLNVSRLKTGKFIIEPVATNLVKMIDEEVSQLVETAKGRHLTLTFHKPARFPILMLDETKIRQVMMNFIDNALYYTEAGGHVDIYLTEKPESIEFTVVDDGIGVPRHEQHHLFTKFYRAPNAKRARPDGTGLGLFMAKKVIMAQGGAIIFKSSEGHGSTFGFTFAKKRLLPPAKTAQTTDEK